VQVNRQIDPAKLAAAKVTPPKVAPAPAPAPTAIPEPVTEHVEPLKHEAVA